MNVRGFLAIVVLAVVLTGCRWIWEEPELGVGVAATNETEHVLTFQLFYPGGSYDLPVVLEPGHRSAVLGAAELQPGSVLSDGLCTVGDLVAFAPDGREVARHLPPLCDGDVWVILEDPGR